MTKVIIPVYFPKAGWHDVVIEKPDGVEDDEFRSAVEQANTLIHYAAQNNLKPAV